MQGISASLQHPNQQFTASSSSTPAPHDSCHTSSVPLPSQLQSDVCAVQQRGRASSGSAPSPAESVQPGVFTGVVVGHSTGWQDHPEVPRGCQGGPGLQVGVTQSAKASRLMSASQSAFPSYEIQRPNSWRFSQYHAARCKVPPEWLHSAANWLQFVVVQIPGTHEAAASHSTAASTSNGRSRVPSSGSQSDGIVLLSVKSADTQPSSHSLTPSTAAFVQSSSRGCLQLDSPHKPPAISSGCIPWDLPLSSSARKSGRAPGDTLAGFLQEQAKAPNVGAQAILPQPASGTPELFVGMVTTDFTVVPSAGQHHSNGSCQTDSQCDARQSQSSSPACLLPTAASSSVSVSGKRSGCMAAECKQELGGSQVAQRSMEPHVDDLSGGAVMLQNPDGSVQYVVLTSDEQRAVQLSIQAKRNKDAGTAEATYTYPVSVTVHGER